MTLALRHDDSSTSASAGLLRRPPMPPTRVNKSPALERHHVFAEPLGLLGDQQLVQCLVSLSEASLSCASYGRKLVTA